MYFRTQKQAADWLGHSWKYILKHYNVHRHTNEKGWILTEKTPIKKTQKQQNQITPRGDTITNIINNIYKR